MRGATLRTRGLNFMTTPERIEFLVCGIDELPDQRAFAATHVLSLLDPECPELAVFAEYAEHERVEFRFHDIIDPIPGQIMPDRDVVAAILDFGAVLATWTKADRPCRVLVHCHMGVSRSTAAMVTLLSFLCPDRSEAEVFEQLRRIRPQAWPNSVMIGHADTLLGREGRLLAALSRHYARKIAEDSRYPRWMRQLQRQRELTMAGWKD